MSDAVGGGIEFLVPYVGDPTLLRATVASALAQSDRSWTLCVVEDGSQGTGVGDWVRNLADPRVTHVLNETNLGLAGNFQRCLDLATSERVVFPGCDDLLHPDYVALVRRTIAQFPAASAMLPGVRVIDRDGRVVHPIADRVKRRLAPQPAQATAYAGEELAASLLHGNWTYFPAICWRREHVARFGFRQDLPVALDLALLFDVLLDDGELVVLPDQVFGYRRHAQSVSSRAAATSDRFAEEARLHDELGERCRDRGWKRAARAARMRVTSRLHAASLLPARVGAGDIRMAARLLRRGVLA